MITDSFDDKTEAIIAPESFFGAKREICDIAIVTFSKEIYQIVLGMYENEQIGELRAVNMTKPIHMLHVNGQKIVFYLSEIGSTLASTDIIEVNWKTGARKFIMFGSAGALDTDATAGKYVIPTQAYRDEGMSYHYAPPADYIGIRGSAFLAELFAGESLPFVTGKVWTTDALYRETRGQVDKRKSEGCIAVEMELAGVQSVCDFYGWELYDFLVTGDVVDQDEYTPDGLIEANHSMDKFFVALRIAKALAEV